ncbi:MAG: dTDP-4-dehydrorhamnose 3,5-epimerase [Gammaproteobacteria bacterium]|nr:MAG: dTDP-4-dehydrorhamnose 3,5-epimerase [Gammaproteobacteria bacterium]
MKRIATSLQDAFLVEPTVHGDARGFFLETWNRRTFLDMGLDLDFVQDNHSKSRQGILRGLHYQTENTQGKLVRVTAGEVFDVIVDLRKSSPTFGRWSGFCLSAQNQHMLWVPPGFAHGFYVVSDFAEFLYKCTDYYNPSAEVSLRWDDPSLAIRWPLVNGESPALSDKDRNGVLLENAPLFK